MSVCTAPGGQADLTAIVRTDTSRSVLCRLDTSGLSARLPPPLFTLCCHSLSCCNIFNMAARAVFSVVTSYS